MADFNATNEARTRSVPPQLIDSGDYGGRQRVLYDEYVTTGSESSGDRIRVGTLRNGQRFLGGRLVFGAMGTGRTLKLGDSEDDDRYLAATSVSAAGSATVAAAAGFGHKPPEDRELFLTVGGGTLAGGQAIKIRVSIVSD
ncbi:hypothetical protein [Pelagibius sp. Alg239-R121]|uniref:hypothetical protein n=1 Tax=Pelagibius sp. Alg239-R121 TaxID=2993448 RepID=UPI0024A6A01D|nr:hypothetical protein [Pelagibius sp. Alg239-R121]